MKKPHSVLLFVAEKDGSSNDSPRMDEGVYGQLRCVGLTRGV